MRSRVQAHGLALLFSVAFIASLLLWGGSGVSAVEPVLTGALSATPVGYVAVKDKFVLKSAVESIRSYPVVLETGTFRGHYFLKIKGTSNTVHAATLAAAQQAALRGGLVFSGVQVE